MALDESFCYEVQVLTENTYIKSLLDHPFLVSKTADFPDEESKNWLLRWVWKSNIADVIEHLEQTIQTTISA
ncbi:hypothetical protein HY772_07065 [Candidatus Woesearchaeota archaeon]|nr:hypothetical protein [Candidatus Woesearchaeota archaeon]